MNNYTNKQRINYIDGFRGIAILMVIFYHAYSRWSNVLTFTKKYDHFILFKNGWLGVPLFFLTSGYVILMTLEKSTSIFNFLQKRFFRLHPPLLVASALIFITAPLFPFRPSGMPNLIDFVPSLIFTEPLWFYRIFHINMGMLESTFWSLCVEIRFYIIFSLIYFKISKDKSQGLILIIFIISTLINLIDSYIINQTFHNFRLALNVIGFQHYGWFASGAYLYSYHQKNRPSQFIYLSIFAGSLNIIYLSFIQFFDFNIFIISSFIFALFISTSLISSLQKIISNPFFLFIGTISYPLYLIHENMMVSLILQIHKLYPQIPTVIVPLFVITFIIFLAYLFNKFLEPYIYKLTSKVLNMIKKLKTYQLNLK